MVFRTLPSIEAAVATFLKSRPEVQAAYIFGSVATGRARRDSDIDVGVLVSDRVRRRDPFQYRLELMTDLMSILYRDAVDLIRLNEAHPLLSDRVLNNFKIILERSDSDSSACAV